MTMSTPVLNAGGGPMPGRAVRAALALADAVATPLVPDDYLDLFAPLQGRTLRARVVAVQRETSDAATIVLRPGRGWRGHQPGQYIRLGVDIDGVRLWRAYSITSPPNHDGSIAVTVKVIPSGKVSTHLVRRLQPGTMLALDQAAGDFVLPATPPAKALFITAGSGITPVMGMLRHHLPTLTNAVVVHSAPTPDDVIFATDLHAFARARRITLIEQHTDAHGMLSVERLLQLVPDAAERETWACGPKGLVDAITGLFEARGWTDRLHVERFRPVMAAVGDGGTVTFTASGTTVDATGAGTLLDAGENAGVLMPSGCRMGVCYGCVLPLEEGAVKDLRTGAVTSASPGDGVLVQTCVSAAAGPCSLTI